MAPFGILILVVGKPSAASFGIGLFVALIGEAVRLWGVGYAGGATRKGVLDAPRLVTAGPYARARHPLYLGNSLMGLGGTIMAAGNASVFLAGILFLTFLLFYGTVYGILIPAEEEFLEKQFGEEYARYKKETRRIIPRMKPYGDRRGEFSWSRAFGSEVHTLVPFLVLVILMAIKIR